jgi:hypothetical protein
MTLPFRSTRKHSANAFFRPLCTSPGWRSIDWHASWRLASGDGGASAAFAPTWAHTAWIELGLACKVPSNWCRQWPVSAGIAAEPTIEHCPSRGRYITAEVSDDAARVMRQARSLKCKKVFSAHRQRAPIHRRSRRVTTALPPLQKFRPLPLGITARTALREKAAVSVTLWVLALALVLVFPRASPASAGDGSVYYPTLQDGHSFRGLR